MAPQVDSPASAPRIGWYGDDFTGATDTLAALAEGGLRTILFLGVPDARHVALAGPLEKSGYGTYLRGLIEGNS